MRFSILTIHPQFFTGFLTEGLIGKAIARAKLELSIVDIRDFADAPHFRVDDKPYGGGPGMVLKPEPIVRALQSLKKFPGEKSRVIVFSAKGQAFTQSKAQDYSKIDHLILICGRYEGIDERVAQFYADEEVRVGDYVLMGGEVAAEIVVEATSRLIPGILGNEESTTDESFSGGCEKEYPQYTRPPVFDGHEVPAVLQRGHHKEIQKWRAAKRASEKVAS